MSRYIIYTYQFSPIASVDASLFGDKPITVTEAMEKKQEFLNEFFTSYRPFKTKRNEYSQKILFQEGGFIAFRIANEKLQSLEEDFKVEKRVNHPSCVVIIDNRKDIQRIAIEDCHNAFSDTNTVAHILTSTFNAFLKQYRLTITIQKEYEKGEFWDIIDRYPKGMSMVRFHFSYPNLPRVSESIDEMIKKASEVTNSKQTTFEFKTPNDEQLVISRNNQQIEALVQASADSGNIVTFKAKGIHRYIFTGDTFKSFEVDDIEASLSADDLLETPLEKLAKLFNPYK